MTLNPEFKARMSALLPDDEAAQFLAAMERPPQVSVRRNRAKSSDFIGDFRQVPWCDCGAYLPGRLPFTFDPLMHAGCYYVQDASSMILHHIARSVAGGKAVRWLDLCAAPGGKATAIADALEDGCSLVANEIVPARAAVLAENVAKWGRPNVAVTYASPADFGNRMAGCFDVVSADVPCSGEGMMRKDEEAVAQWSLRLVEQCAARQRGIIDDVWAALRPGGFFIYSTCTFNREENELMLDYMATRYGAVSVELPQAAGRNIRGGIGTRHHCYRFMPHLTEGEGLFVAVMRKPGDEVAATVKSISTPRRLIHYGELLIGDRVIYEREGVVTAVPADGFLAAVAASLRTLSAGVGLGSDRGKGFVPDIRLALSTALNREAFARAEVDYTTAIAYLRGEAISLPAAPKGFVIIEYEGAALGLVKNIGNRANNQHPASWRIRSSHIAAEPPRVVTAQRSSRAMP